MRTPAVFAWCARLVAGVSLLSACGSDASPTTATNSGGTTGAGQTSTGGTHAATAGSGGASGSKSSTAGRPANSGGTNNAAAGKSNASGGGANVGNNASGGNAAGGRNAAGGASATGGKNANGGTNATGGRAGRSAGGGNAGASNSDGGAGASGTASAPAGWTLAWSDEFDGPSGQSPDSTKWAFDVGGDGWGNSELEYYTNRPDNSATDGNGNLVITLKSETYMNRSYTSARLKTEGKFTQAYGRFESRIKIPRGQGIWPAFWMLGDDIGTNPWPACGEIDIMENVGKEPSINHGSMHGPGYSGGSPLTGSYTLPGGAALADDFHVYAIEWETNVVRFYVDDNNYETKKNTDVPAGAKWVYDHPFFMILNIAIGGSFPGAPDATTMLPQTMTVDYVRVYTKS